MRLRGQGVACNKIIKTQHLATPLDCGRAIHDQASSETSVATTALQAPLLNTDWSIDPISEAFMSVCIL